MAGILCGSCKGVETPLTTCSKNMWIKGRAQFTALPVTKNTNVVVQYSFDGFGSSHNGLVITNPLGFLSIPYDITDSVRAFCPLSAGQKLQVRAFQDTNGNGVWDSGEVGGRDDGTQDGNATYLDHTVKDSQVSISFGTEIFLDATSP